MKQERQKMSRANRAKQFAPFAALSGLEAAIKKKEEEHKRAVEMEVEKLQNPEINK